ncbi:MAG: hypothetical protein KTR19_13400 [Hyphomicrobiales bacterium]|nr:hypothetical protein [Hyphomicrobiales bacterium]
MKKAIPLAVLGAGFALLATATTAHAGEWEEHSRTIYGPYGGKYESHGGCSHGRCETSKSWTGPEGRTVTRKGYTDCYDGECRGGAVWDGPRGKTIVKRRYRRW